jgi:hypothetical protein
MKIASSKKTQYNDFSVFVMDHVQNRGVHLKK